MHTRAPSFQRLGRNGRPARTFSTPLRHRGSSHAQAGSFGVLMGVRDKSVSAVSSSGPVELVAAPDGLDDLVPLVLARRGFETFELRAAARDAPTGREGTRAA